MTYTNRDPTTRDRRATKLNLQMNKQLVKRVM